MKQPGHIRIVKARDFDHAANLCAWAYGIVCIGKDRYRCMESKSDYFDYLSRITRENPNARPYR